MNEPFGSAMIERFAAENQMQYFIDQDGDVCMSFFRQGTETDGGALMVWFNAQHEELLYVQGVLAVSDVERADLLEWFNAWHLQSPWLILRLAEAGDAAGRHIVSAAVLYPVASGTTYEAVAGMCRIGLGAIHEAWMSFGDWIVDPRTREVARNTTEWPSAGGETPPGGQANAPWAHDFRPVGAEDAGRRARFN